jgi:maleate isomerase
MMKQDEITADIRHSIARHRVFIGTITPSSNTIVERITLEILRSFPSASAHFSRTPVVGARDAFPDRYDLDGMLGAARLLGHARLDVICWNGSKGGSIGFHHDRELCARIAEETGAKATTSILALDEVLRGAGRRRIAFVSPYDGKYQAKTIETFRREGYDCVAEAHCDLSDNFSFSQVPPATIEEMVRQVAASAPDAIVTICTNFPAAPVIGDLERELGVPIYDTTSIAVWKSLSLAGVDTSPGRAWGRIFGG